MSSVKQHDPADQPADSPLSSQLC